MTQQDRDLQDTLIMQKVNQHHRAAFRERFPGQVEHAMRLTAERLQACLAKPPGCDLADPLTWPAPARDLRDLAEALHALYRLHQDIT